MGNDRQRHALPVPALDMDKKGGQTPFFVMETESKGCGTAGKYLNRRQQLGGQAFQVGHPGQTGHRHERQQPRYNQEQQVIAGIDGREAQQKRNGDIQRTGLADLQTKGSAMSLMSVRNSSPLWAVSWSGRMTRR